MIAPVKARNRIHPLTQKPIESKPRVDVAQMLAQAKAVQKRINATYDAARTGVNDRYWANADQYDADSANSRNVREKLVPRARYEVNNNGYADGIAQTYATDLVGTGPKLRMLTGSQGFNQLVEREWMLWSKAVKLRRKLWCQAHAKLVDGEGFGVARTNMGVNHACKLDYVLYETEQFQSPQLPWNEPGRIDGIRFDRFGNPTHYELMRWHPGSTDYHALDWKPELIPARFVMQWFTMRRPGQHRGMPEMASTLNSGASARRWREATVLAAETAASYSALIKTNMLPDDLEGADPVDPMTSTDIEHNMMTALPMGWDVSQLRAEHPGATYEAFHKALINEQARPKSMPYNKAACDSSSYNYASGRLDHQTYYGALDVDREDGNDLVLDPLFEVWFDEAVRVFGWLGGNPDALSPAAKNHQWDWPKHLAADIKAEADANRINSATGRLSPSQMQSNDGNDFEDHVAQLASDYGVTVQEMKRVLLTQNFPQGALALQQTESPEGPNGEEES